MRRFIGVLTLAALAVVPARAMGQETYTIKFKPASKGIQTRQHKTYTYLQKGKVADLEGKTIQEQDTTTTVESVFEETILEVSEAGKGPTLVKRVYEKAVAQVDKRSTVLPYQGKTILIELKDGDFQYRYEGGGAITGDDAKWLDKELKEKHKSDVDLDSILLPTGPVKEGESWKIPLRDLVKALGAGHELVIHSDKATASGKLVKAYRQNGSQFVDLHIVVELPLKALKANDMEAAFHPRSQLTMELKLSACIDGSLVALKAQMEMLMRGTADVPAENPQRRATLFMRLSGEETVTEVTKK